MKKLFGYFVVFALVAMPLVSLAAEFRGGEQSSTTKSEKISNDLYMGGGGVTSAGDVTGDLFIGGGNIIISGDVSEDVFVGGGNVTILSNVGDDLRAGGGTVVIAGKVGGDLMTGGGQVTVGGGGVGGDAVIGGGNVRIDAPIAGKLYAGGGNVYINSTVGGDVKIEAEKLTLGPSAVISGSLTYKSKAKLTQEEGAVVKGKIDYIPRAERATPSAKFAAIFSAILLWKFFALLASALLIGMMFRRWSRELVNIATRRPLFELGRGVLVLVAMPAISIILLMTLVGVPFGIVGLLGFVIMMLFAWIVTPIIVGSVVYKYFSKRELEVSWKTILLGVFICTLLGLVPFIGWVAQTLLMYITLGSVVALKLQIVKEWR